MMMKKFLLGLLAATSLSLPAEAATYSRTTTGLLFDIDTRGYSGVTVGIGGTATGTTAVVEATSDPTGNGTWYTILCTPLDGSGGPTTNVNTVGKGYVCPVPAPRMRLRLTAISSGTYSVAENYVGLGVASAAGGSSGGGGGATTIADGADVAEGATTQTPCSSAATACSNGQRLSKIEQTLEDTTTPSAVKSVAVTTGGATPYHATTAASANSTLISTGAHTLYTLSLTGLNTTAGWLRLYDTAGAPTCSSATGAVHSYLVIGSATQQGGQVVPLPAHGEAFSNGLAYCFTGGSADTDNTSGPAGVMINLSYK
jgi:hypothetical protein